MSSRTLAELLASVERKKQQSLRERAGLPADARVEGIQLETLAYLLTERSGSVRVQSLGEELRVGEPGGSTHLVLRGEAARVLLSRWGIDPDQARSGIEIELVNGKRA